MKRLYYGLLSILLLFILAGCSGGENKTAESDNAPAAETQSIVSEAPKEVSADDAAENTAAQNSAAVTAEPAEEVPASGGRVLVAYFSRTGHTKPLAEYAAAYYGADLFEINAKEPYTDADIDYSDSDSRTTKEQNDKSVRPEIEGTVAQMEQYDTVILAYPIWWGQAPRIIDTFLESYDFSGKTILPFCTSASSGIGTSDDNLHSLVSDSVNWLEGRRFAAGTSAEELTAWLEEVLPVGSTADNGSKEEVAMKLLINGTEIPVTWENNTAVEELLAETADGDITVSMSMYGGWEQVGSLGRSYTRNDTQITAVNGDIVLYSGNQIVVFYGSNDWAYTRLGRMNLSADEVTELLSHGNVTLTLTR